MWEKFAVVANIIVRFSNSELKILQPRTVARAELRKGGPEDPWERDFCFINRRRRAAKNSIWAGVLDDAAHDVRVEFVFNKTKLAAP